MVEDTCLPASNSLNFCIFVHMKLVLQVASNSGYSDPRSVRSAHVMHARYYTTAYTLDASCQCSCSLSNYSIDCFLIAFIVISTESCKVKYEVNHDRIASAVVGGSSLVSPSWRSSFCRRFILLGTD